MKILSRYSPALLGLVAAAALAAGGCKGDRERPAEPIQVAQGTEDAAPAVPGQPVEGQLPVDEKPYQLEEAPGATSPGSLPPPALQPPGEPHQEPQVVVVEPEPRRNGTNSSKSASLEARERQLAQRQAELEAREERLRREREEIDRDREQAEAGPAPEEAAEEVQEPVVAPEPEPVREEPRRIEATVPAGTTLEAEFTRSVSSETAEVGDTFRARVARGVHEDGVLAIPAGSELVGEVTEVGSLRRVGGQARLGLRFTDLILPSGETVPISASFLEQGRSETRRDAATIGGATAGGAILGRILNKGNKTKGSVIGAIIGAAAGTAIASRTPGEEVTIPEGTVVDVRLDRSVEVRRRP
jgi:type IV secretory pathway VirB10-like protein